VVDMEGERVRQRRARDTASDTRDARAIFAAWLPRSETPRAATTACSRASSLHARDPHVNLFVEGDPALAEAILRAGATLTFELLRMGARLT